jgi:excisionase family DNA binding protein
MTNLLNITEVAKELGVSTFTVRAEIYRRRLAVVRVGRRVLVHPKDLAAFILANRTPAKNQREGA